MQFGLSESQEILKDNARKFFAGECPINHVRKLAETGSTYDADLWSKMAAQGFTGIIFPEPYGGMGMSVVDLILLMEEAGRALVPGPFFATVALAATVIDAVATDAQKKKYLAPICSGDARSTLAEIEAGVQMTFAIITPALIAGSFAERMKFSAMLWFIGIWATVVYAPIAHWVWGPDGIFNSGNNKAWVHVLDFAGGTVVHVNSGVAGLMCALMLGKRKGLGSEHMAPHNLVLTLIGASLLWVGWFGFNAGSAVSAGLQAGMAMTVTQIATATAAPGLGICMKCGPRRATKHALKRICFGVVPGLVAMTPSLSCSARPASVDAAIASLSTQSVNAALRRYVRPDAFVDVFAGDFAKKQ